VLSADIISKLRYVETDGSEDLALFPDFLIVGPQRTGTTWLHAYLRIHPQIFLSEPKELFFFSRLEAKGDPRFESSRLSWYLQFFEEPLWRRLAKSALCLRRSGELYRPIIRGEATASYAAMENDLIDEVVTLNPEIKVITMVRDPVERAWSHAKKDLVRKTGRSVEDVPADEFKAFFRDDYQLRCAAYVDNHERWRTRLGTGNLFVGFFDDVAERPARFLHDAMTFLGVRSDDRYVSDDVGEQINPTSGTSIPEHYRTYLEALLAEHIAALDGCYGRRRSVAAERE